MASGKKKLELRLNDFGVNEGEMFILEERNSKTKNTPEERLRKKITYIGKYHAF